MELVATETQVAAEMFNEETILGGMIVGIEPDGYRHT